MKLNTTVEVRILRQDAPRMPKHWQRFQAVVEHGVNVTSLLRHIAAEPITASGKQVAPVAYESNCLEEVCGACTMLINGHVRQACSTLVETLLKESPNGIELRPLSKFPVLRDLVVDRRRIFRALEKLECWIPVDGYYDMGPGPRQSQQQQQVAYPMSQCMSCGCCLEACPEYSKIDLCKQEHESDEDFEKREQTAFDRSFIGAHAMNQVLLTNMHPTGRNNAKHRIDAIMRPGGVQMCGNSQNCTAVCPKRIPLTNSWGRAKRAATLRMFQRMFDE